MSCYSNRSKKSNRIKKCRLYITSHGETVTIESNHEVYITSYDGTEAVNTESNHGVYITSYERTEAVDIESNHGVYIASYNGNDGGVL